jgi:hypothetical protein
MNPKIGLGKPEDASFLAWVILISGRAPHSLLAIH